MSINLLSDTEVIWTLPTISDIPVSCYVLTFDKLYHSSGDEVSLEAGSISFTATEITLTHVISSFNDRKSIFDDWSSFYFIGDVTGSNIEADTTTD